VLHNWIGVIEEYVRRGLTEDEAVKEPLDVQKDVDPYPIGQRLFSRDEWVTEANIRNVYKRVVARQAATPDSGVAGRR
jgi:hypothetical protein